MPIFISENAKIYFKNLLKKEKKNTNLRIFIINPGTIKAECGVSYCHSSEIEKNDITINYGDFLCYVNKYELKYFKKSKIDISKKNSLNYKLILHAPYAKKSLENKFFSNIEKKVDNYFTKKINPNLSAHGGKIKLIKINEKGYALVEFSGGCNGCSMISVTLKEGIEKNFLKKFSDLKGIKDITNHKIGSHSFFK
ncbi:NifU family protein [Buchnera aphidicola (Kurisakia onigurumii)]|uniref:NifU family protein n=1 Tax=Buchnera aphidicola TaxID=9 RepID=UPI0031B69C1F